MNRKQRRPAPQHSLEYDFHGLTSAEAADRLLRVLDENEGEKGIEITIIHGMGAGILAQEVERIAVSDPRVQSHQRGTLNPGATTLILSGVQRKSGSRSPSSQPWETLPEPPVRRRKR